MPLYPNLSNTYATVSTDVRPTLRIGRPPGFTMISAFQTGHGWTGDGTGATWNLNNTSDPGMGSQCCSVTTDGAAHTAGLTSPALSAIDMTNNMFAVLVKVDQPVRLNAVTLLAGTSGLGEYYNLYAAKGGGLATLIPGKWTWCHFGYGSQAGKTASATLTGVVTLKLRFQDLGSGAIVGKFGAIGYYPKTTAFPNGVVSFTFDDSSGSQYTRARTALDTYGYPASAFVIQDLLGQANMLTSANLDTLHDQSRWDIGGHAWTQALHNAGYDTLTDAQITSEMLLLKAWLVGRGYRGADYFAWPKGASSAAADLIAPRFWTFARSVSGLPMATPSPDNPMFMRCTNVDGTTATSTYTTLIDNAFTYGHWLLLNYHDITAGASGTGGSTQCSLTDFTTVVAYCASKGIPVRTVSEVLRATGVLS